MNQKSKLKYYKKHLTRGGFIKLKKMIKKGYIFDEDGEILEKFNVTDKSNIGMWTSTIQLNAYCFIRFKSGRD